MKKLVVNNRVYGAVVSHDYSPTLKTHIFGLYDDNMTISIKEVDGVTVDKTAYSYKVTMPGKTVYGYQILQIDTNGNVKPFGGIYNRERDAILACSKLKNQTIKLWDGDTYVGEIDLAKHEYTVSPVTM